MWVGFSHNFGSAQNVNFYCIHAGKFEKKKKFKKFIWNYFSILKNFVEKVLILIQPTDLKKKKKL